MQITREHKCGVIVTPGDVDGLTNAVLALYTDRALAARLGTQARQAALLFDRPNQTAAYAALLRRVAAAEPPQSR